MPTDELNGYSNSKTRVGKLSSQLIELPSSLLMVMEDLEPASFGHFLSLRTLDLQGNRVQVRHFLGAAPPCRSCLSWICQASCC